LPLAREDAALEPAAVAASTASSPEEPRLDGLRVLVADRGAEVREVVAGILGQAGAQVLPAASGREALEIVARERPDVLLVELDMGDESGYALLAKVRGLPPDDGGTTPAVALSSFVRTEDRVRSLLAGFQMHMAKPLQPAELLAVVASLAGRRQP